jgi:hypothetical protein
MRKILGIINIVATVLLLAMVVFLSATGWLRVSFREPISIVYFTLFILFIPASIASGILVLIGNRIVWKVLASISLTLIIIILFLLFPGILFALFGD